MSIVVSCQCGSRFKANANLAGQRKKCPSCGAVITIPRANPTRQPTAGQGLVAACQCGKQFKAPAHLAGKRVACPACKQPIQVPAAVGNAAPTPPQPDPLGGVDDLWNSAPAAAMSSPLASQPLGGYATPPGQQKKKKPFKIQPWMIFSVGGVVVAGVLWIVVSAVMDSMGEAERQATAELDSWRAEGMPTNAAELAEFAASLRKSPDTTDIWQQAIEQLAPISLDRAAGPYLLSAGGSRTSLLTPPPGRNWIGMNRAEQILERHSVALQSLYQAVGQRGSPNFVADYSQGRNIDLSYVQHLSNGTLLLGLEAYIHAHRGDSAKTLASLSACCAVMRVLGEQPIENVYLIRQSIGRSLYHLVATFVPRVKFTAEELNELDGLLRNLEFDRPLRTALIGECATGIIAIGDPSTIPAGKFPPPVMRMAADSPDRNVAYLVSRMRQLVQAAALPIQESIHEGAAINAAKLKDAETNGELFSMFLLPSSAALFEVYGESVALRDAARLSISVSKYYHQNGRWPGDFSAAGIRRNEIAKDPFDGEPLRYQVASDGFVIYSVGRDRRDDRGKGDIFIDEPDIVFRVKNMNN